MQDADVPVTKSPFKLFALVFIFSIPFWLLGAIAGDAVKSLPINLPISALMFICPMAAALLLTYQEQKYDGARRLLQRVFDYKRVKQKIWYIPVIFLMPIIMALSYIAMQVIGLPLPEPQIPVLMIPVFLVLFFISATGEELGWSGYAIDSMQDQWGALKAGIILGSVWAVWHVLPFIQAHDTPTWIIGQCLGTVGLRIIMVWLYNNTGKSIFAAILFHSTINVSEFLFPNYGSHYDPTVTGIIIIIIAICVTVLWGSKTLARYQFSDVVSII